jgi:hypothetical protein
VFYVGIVYVYARKGVIESSGVDCKSKVFWYEGYSALVMLSAFATVAALVLVSAALDVCNGIVAGRGGLRTT